jgi:hypothetical protein
MLILTLLLSPFAFSAADSVAVFHRPEKVVILVNERGSNGRIQQFMNAWNAGPELYWHSETGDFTINCGRNEAAASCTFKLLPSANVQIGAKEAEGHAQMNPAPADVHFSFESSRENFFEFTSARGVLTMHTKKR